MSHGIDLGRIKTPTGLPPNGSWTCGVLMEQEKHTKKQKKKTKTKKAKQKKT